jgi:hypothetical protein
MRRLVSADLRCPIVDQVPGNEHDVLEAAFGERVRDIVRDLCDFWLGTDTRADNS